MAGRVNTKFVFILSAVLCVSVLGFAGAAYYFNNRDYKTHLIRGRELLAAGDFKDAVDSFERAAQRSKSDIPVTQEYIEALKLLPAADYVEAQNTLRSIRDNTRHLTNIDPDSDELFQDFVDLIKGYALELGQDGDTSMMWILQTALSRLEINPDDALARRYASIYALGQMSADQAVEEIHKVRDDLEWAREQYPEDTDVMRSLATWKLFEAKRQDQPGGDAELSTRLREEATVLNDNLLATDPDNPRLMLDHLQIQSDATIDRDVDDPYKVMKPMLDKLEAKLLADPQPSDVVSTVVQYIKAVYATDIQEDAQDGKMVINEGQRRGIALLRAANQANPDNPTYQLLLGKELKLLGEYEEALGYIQAVAGLSTQGPYLEVLRNYKFRLNGAIESADLMMTLAGKSGPGPERDDLLSKAEQALSEVSTAGLDSAPRVLMLKGKLSLIQGKAREGLINIDKAADLYDTNRYSREKAEALLLSAQARAKQGDWGAAAERYEQLLKINPNIPTIRLQLASTYLRSQQFDKAHRHIDAVLSDDPMNEQALVVQAKILAKQGQFDEAIAVYNQLDLNHRPDLAIGYAQLLIQGNRKAQASKIVKAYYDADPSNIQLLALLLDTEESLERKSELIAISRDAGADPMMLAMIEQRLDPGGEVDQEQLIETLAQNQTDPFLRAINSARLYARAGNQVKALESLDEAERIKPDDKAVVDMRFENALAEGKLDEAQRLADIAEQNNFDEAAGRFYLARLQAARKQYQQAINTLHLGLDDIPINSDGWRLLGDILAINNDYSEAASAFETSLEQRPDNLGSLRGLAAIRDKQGRHDEALHMIKVAFNQNPQNAQIKQLYLAYESQYGDKQLVLKIRREMIKSEPENIVNHRILALLLAELDQPDEAMQMIQGVIDTEGMTPTNVLVLSKTHLLLGDTQRGGQVIRSYIQGLGAKVQTRDYLILARYLKKAGDGEGALSAYAQAIALESEQREASRELADVYFDGGVYQRAVPLYREMYAQFPEEPRLGLRLADALVKTREFDEASRLLSDMGDAGSSADALRALIAVNRDDQNEAVRLINAAIEADPGKAILHYERAAIYMKDPLRQADAMQDLNTALTLDPNHLLSRRLLIGLYLAQGQRSEAIRELRTLVSRHPDFAEGRLKLITMLTQDGDLTSTMVLARAGIEAAPQDPTWHTVMASLAIKAKKPQDAIDSFAAVFELSPTPGDLLNLVSLQIDNKGASDALAMMREHADMVNQQPVLQAAMGRALDASGNASQASQVSALAMERCTSFDQLMAVVNQLQEGMETDQIQTLLKGLANTPSESWAGIVLARLEVERGDHDAAVKQLMEMDTLISPQDTQLRLVYDSSLALALHGAGRPQEADPIYQRVLESQPDNISVLNNLAYMLAEDLDRAKDALPFAQRAEKLDPENAQILDTLGWIQFKLGDIELARATLEHSIAATPLSASHLHLAQVLIKQGKKVQASRHLKTAADLAEQNNETEILQEAKDLLARIDQLSEASLSQ